MTMFLLVTLALPYIVAAEEDSVAKEKRSLNHFYSSSISLTLKDLLNKDLLNNNEHLLFSNFHNTPEFVSHNFPTFLNPNLFSPGYTLIHNLNQPFTAGVAPPVSLPNAVTPQPPPEINLTPASLRPPATSYGVPDSKLTPYLPPPPPTPAPITRPTQVGRLGSGSLGYVHLGNGLYALGSGSLGYTPPSQPAKPFRPAQPLQLPQPPQLPNYRPQSYINYESYKNYL
ncbi:hypothetical protein FQR65_LT10744 [Abscondita terminalis]|nr:hypothetical protein FQR65_LT10744 [Abscondita terminalis]